MIAVGPSRTLRPTADAPTSASTTITDLQTASISLSHHLRLLQGRGNQSHNLKSRAERWATFSRHEMTGSTNAIAKIQPART